MLDIRFYTPFFFITYHLISNIEYLISGDGGIETPSEEFYQNKSTSFFRFDIKLRIKIGQKFLCFKSDKT